MGLFLPRLVCVSAALLTYEFSFNCGSSRLCTVSILKTKYPTFPHPLPPDFQEILIYDHLKHDNYIIN